MLKGDKSSSIIGLNPDYALENRKGGDDLSIFANMPSIHGRLFTASDIFNTFLFEWLLVQAPNAKQ